MKKPLLAQAPDANIISGFLVVRRMGRYMRVRWFGLLLICCLLACDSSRIYDQNFDFENRYWTTDVKPEFEFKIEEINAGYDLFASVRNETSYPNANLYFTYSLMDSTGKVLEEKLVSEDLFDRKSGKPFGNTVLGDIYDHRLLLLENYRFQQPGKYKLRYDQSMRTDTLQGVLAIGLRIDRHVPRE